MDSSYLRRLASDFASRERSLRERVRTWPLLEMLEDRVVPSVLSAYSWANAKLTVSFVPDGSQIFTSQSRGTQLTNLFHLQRCLPDHSLAGRIPSRLAGLGGRDSAQFPRRFG